MCRTCDTGFGLDADRLLAETPADLFENWRAVYDAEPWDAERSDLATGTLIAHLVACHGGDPKPPKDYMPFLKRPAEEKPQSQDEMRAAWDQVRRIMEERERKAESGKRKGETIS